MDEEKYVKVAEQFHNVIVNSEMDDVSVLYAFMQVWLSCNVQMELGLHGRINVSKFKRDTVEMLNNCVEDIEESIQEIIDEVQIYKQQH